MIVDVTENVRLRFDAGNWTLERRIVIGVGPEENRRGRKPKEENIGEERWSAVGYYGTLECAASQLLVRHMDLLIDRDVVPVRDLIEAIRAAEKTIVEAVKKG